MPSRLEYAFRYVWLDEINNLCGTNKKEVAEYFGEEFPVIDVHAGSLFVEGSRIQEAEIPEDEEDEDEDEKDE